MDDGRIVIRGTGLITPLGGDVDETWQNLLAGEAIRTHSLARLHERSRNVHSIHRPLFRKPLSGRRDTTARSAELQRASEKASRVERLAHSAVSEAIITSALPLSLLDDPRTALVVATSKGGADHWLSGGFLPPELITCFGLADVADSLAQFIRHGDGPRLTFSGACASGLHALIRAAMLIEHGDADRAIVVAAESSLHPLFLQSFRRLGVLPAEGEPCRPFDVHRSGFLVSEAAAAVVLERMNQADPPGEKPIVQIDRYAFAGDAGHLTGFSGHTLRRLLAQVIDGRPVDLIHAHGTGTEANDATELAAIDHVISSSAEHEKSPLSVYSHKGALGHTLGAAGLISVVLNTQMHRQGMIPGNANLREALDLRHGTLTRGIVQRRVRRSLAAAAGFGGATAVVSLTTCE